MADSDSSLSGNLKARMRGGTTRLFGGSSNEATAGVVLVTAATFGNFNVDNDAPAAADTDGINFDADAPDIPLTLLVWRQTEASQNGIYEYDPSIPSGRWSKVSDFDESTRANLILVRYGKRFGGCKFMVTADNTVQILFPARFRVDHGSGASGETLSGLGAMVSTYTPAAGDVVYVRGEGIYIARAGEWTQIGQAAPRTPDLSALDSIGYFDSDVYAVLTAADAESDCEWVEHEAAIDPSELTPEP